MIVRVILFVTHEGEGSYKNFDKTHVKLFPNFTSHLLITHTYNCKKNIPGISVDSQQSDTPGDQYRVTVS